MDEKSLRTEITEEEIKLSEEDNEILGVFKRCGSPNEFRELFFKIKRKIDDINDDIWLKRAKYSLNYYSPEQIFLVIEPQVNALNDILPVIKQSYKYIKNK